MNQSLSANALPQSGQELPKASLWGALANSLSTRSTAPAIEPVPRNQALPLSFAQQRLWFLQQADPGNVTYNLPFAWRLKGSLNLAALRQSFSLLVQRHESLRTNFAAAENGPVQVIAATRPVELEVIELPAPNDQALFTAIVAKAQQPFDLAQDPLIRLYLFRLGEREHVLLVAMHHIICDASSLTVIFRELQLAYAAFSAQTVPALPELPIQYADYAAWQRSWLQGDVLKEQLDYWRRQLAGRLPLLDLPSDHARPAKQTFRGARFPVNLPPELVSALRQFRKREGATAFNCLLAAFQALLFRYTGQGDLLVGAPMANRTSTELLPLVGFFVNTVVFRTPVTDEMTFRQLLEHVRQVSLDAYAHQELPFERLVEELKPERSLSHTPLFQVMFSFQSLPRRGLELAGLQVQMLQFDPGISKFDFTLDLNETPEGLAGFFEYSTDLFDQPTIERMARHFQNLLAGAIADPSQPLWRLPLLSDEERKQLLSLRPSGSYPREIPVHELFRLQAAKTPAHPAVWAQDCCLTYGELNRRSDHLANYLRTRGIGPEVMVGLCLERSFDLIVTMFGVLKAGGAYVPLDPDYPQDRIRFMISDAAMPLILSQRKLAGCLPAGAPVVWMEDLRPILADPAEPSQEDRLRTRPNDLAYVIYTSGSTGTPKGVMVEHGALVEHALDCQSHYQYKPTDRLLQTASPSFDVAVEQIFPPLVGGAQLVLREPVLWTPAELQKKLAELEITILNPPPAYLNQMAEEWSRSPQTVSSHKVRLVIVGGEEMQPQIVKKWQLTPFNNVPLRNEYGPTENIVSSTWFELPPSDPDRPRTWRRVPIGTPRGYRPHYVLDRWGQLVPIGVAGELYIGGTVIARGYHNRPELTRERFVPDPFSGQPGARMYKTGDLVRRLPDGNLEFLGRIDQQVKVRGFRVELGEIESVLRQHPQLGEPVVALVGEPEKRLVAYYVNNSASSEPGYEELRQFARERLPDYMVPAQFIALPALPMTPSGKVDRNALPIPEVQSRSREQVPPRTATESAIACIWREVLKRESIGVHDNFFELGGHSLLATQILSRLRPDYPSATVQDLFEWPTVAGLSTTLEGKKAQGGKSVPKLVALGRAKTRVGNK